MALSTSGKEANRAALGRLWCCPSRVSVEGAARPGSEEIGCSPGPGEEMFTAIGPFRALPHSHRPSEGVFLLNNSTLCYVF